MIQVTTFNNLTIRYIVEIVNNISNFLFVARDVAEALGYSKSSIEHISNLFKHVDKKYLVKRRIPITYKNGIICKREITCLTEEGLYQFLAKSKKPLAKEFKKYVEQTIITSNTSKLPYIERFRNVLVFLANSKADQVKDDSKQKKHITINKSTKRELLDPDYVMQVAIKYKYGSDVNKIAYLIQAICSMPGALSEPLVRETLAQLKVLQLILLSSFYE